MKKILKKEIVNMKWKEEFVKEDFNRFISQKGNKKLMDDLEKC